MTEIVSGVVSIAVVAGGAQVDVLRAVQTLPPDPIQPGNMTPITHHIMFYPCGVGIK